MFLQLKIYTFGLRRKFLPREDIYKSQIGYTRRDEQKEEQVPGGTTATEMATEI